METEFGISDFERLLRRRDADVDRNIVDRIDKQVPKRLVADKNASIDDFILMLSKIVSKVMKKQKVEFKPDEGIRLTADQAERLDHPYVTFRILDSHPRLVHTARVRDSVL